MTRCSFDLDPTFWQLEEAEQLEALGLEPDRGPRRQSWRETRQAMADLVEDVALDESFEISYTPSRYERAWLAASLGPFIQEHLIIDVEAMIKGGKEASVYRCAAHPSLGVTHVAAKVYRPRQFRNLRNDAAYREGRLLLTPSGSEIKPTDGRVKRAVRNRTAFGREVLHLSWMMHEYDALTRLRRLGADVPMPVGVGGNAILMGYIGGPEHAAPTLHEVQVSPIRSVELREQALRHVEILLRAGLVHGDLSAFNLLYWDDRLILIDFPQVVDVAGNPQARSLFRRDLQRLNDYFAPLGAPIDVEATMDALWERHVGASAPAMPVELMLEKDLDS